MSANATFTELVTTTARTISKDIADNVSDHIALLRHMKSKGKIKTENGGTEIVLPLEYSENGTATRYQGYDQLNTNASDVLSAAKFDWRNININVTASGEEIRKNANSRPGMKKLVTARVDNAKRTGMNVLSEDIYSDGSASRQIGGLAHLVQTGGAGTVGGINATTYPFWQNKVTELTGTNDGTYAVLTAGMSALWLKTTRGSDTTDCIVMSHDFYTVFEQGIQTKARYADVDSASEGFVKLKYKSADVMFDDNANFGTTAEKAYFLNTDFLYLIEHPDARWTKGETKTPTNQDAVIIPFYWMGQLVCSNRARQGVLIDAA